MLRTSLRISVMSFSSQQIHDDNIPQNSTSSSDIHVDWATEAMLQEIQCRFGLLFEGLKRTSISSLDNMPLQVQSLWFYLLLQSHHCLIYLNAGMTKHQLFVSWFWISYDACQKKITSLILKVISKWIIKMKLTCQSIQILSLPSS